MSANQRDKCKIRSNVDMEERETVAEREKEKRSFTGHSKYRYVNLE